MSTTQVLLTLATTLQVALGQDQVLMDMMDTNSQVKPYPVYPDRVTPGLFSNRHGSIRYNGGMQSNLGNKAAMACNTADGCRGPRIFWLVHNSTMYLCWVLFMFSILLTARYFRQYWRKSIYIHTSIGVATFFLTLGAGMIAWERNYTNPDKGYFMAWYKWASLLENIATFYALSVCLTGMLAWFYRRYGNYEWGTTKMLKLGKFHKYFSYVFIFFS